MKADAAAASAFVKEGTSVIFGLLGDGQCGWWSSIAQYPGIKFVDAREEGAALTMAEGWASITGKVGVASCTHGPGLTRMYTSLITATRSHTPVVVFTSKTAFNNTQQTQHLDQSRMVESTGAGYIEVLNPNYTEAGVREAFYRARLEQRPYVYCLPHDLQNKDIDSEGDDYQPSSVMFSGQQRIRPDLDRLNQAVEIIAAARKPVVLLGKGGMDAKTKEVADRIAKRIGALITTSLIAQGALAESEYYCGISGLFSSRAVMQLFEEADCVIALGAGLNVRTIEGGYLYPHAKVIHVDIQPHLMMGNNRSADCYIQGDALVTAQELEELLTRRGVSKEGYRTAEVRKVLRDADRDPAEFDIEPGVMDPRDVLRTVDEAVPSNIGLVMGGGHSFTFSALLMKKPRVRHTYVTSFGCIGQTLPLSIGVAVALNGEPVVEVSGDGGSLQHIQELETAARLGVKLLFVVLNDEAYGAEYHKLKASNRDANLSYVRTPDFGAVGRGFGCRGKQARTPEEVAAGINEFLSGEGPMVLDCRLSRNAVSISYRRLHYGQDA